MSLLAYAVETMPASHPQAPMPSQYIQDSGQQLGCIYCTQQPLFILLAKAASVLDHQLCHAALTMDFCGQGGGL